MLNPAPEKRPVFITPGGIMSFFKLIFISLIFVVFNLVAAPVALTGLKAWNHAVLAPGSDCRVTVSAKSDNGAGGVGLDVKVNPETTYQVSFKASGNVNLIGMVNAPGFEKGRFDFLPMAALEKDPKDFTGKFTTPADCKKVYLVLFVWRQDGEFAVSDLTLNAVDKSPALALGSVKSSEAAQYAAKDLSMMFEDDFYWGKFINGIRTKVHPAGWEFVNFDGNTMPQTGGLTGDNKGNHTLAVAAADKGAAGWMLDWHYLEKNRDVALSGELRTSPEYANNQPLVFLSWADVKRNVISQVAVPVPAVAEKWAKFGLNVPAKEIPDKAVFYSVTLASRGNNGAGKVFYDKINVGVPKALGNILQLRANELGNWYFKGEAVKITAKGELPADLTKLSAEVFDSNGQKVAEISVDRQTLATDGLVWQPTAPGYYEIKFTAETAKGKQQVVEDYKEGIWQNNQFRIFTQNQMPFVVSPLRRGELRAEWLGFSIGAGKIQQQRGINDTDLSLAMLLGSGFVRPHGCKWGDFEPEKGKFDWYLDPLIDRAHKEKLGIVLDIYGTAQWASSTPDDVRMQLGWMPMYATMAPADMNDWGNFITALVKHYRDRVDKYELWNEPHIKGFSVFWNDTPEKFVEIMKVGSAAVRANQPEAEIWIGGMGQRYLPFYESIVKLGVRQYYDVMPLHGRDYNPESFREIDRRYQSKEPIYSSSEWHAILVQFQSSPPNHRSTDRELAKVMTLDLLRQFKTGVRDITAFCTIGYGRVAALAFKREMGDPMPQAAGFFDPVPYLTVRYPALVLQRFAAELPKRVQFLGEYRMGDVKAVLLASGDQKTLVVWQDGEKSLAVPAELAKVLTKNSVIRDWEGKTVDLASFAVAPETFYFVSDIDNSMLPQAAADVLTFERKAQELKGPKGVYGSAALIQNGKLVAANAKWVTGDWQTFGDISGKQAKFAAGINNGYFELAVDTDDAVFAQNNHRNTLYDGDSLQFAFDSDSKGYADKRIEFQAALTPTGVELYKEFAPNLGGDLPGGYTSPGNLVDKDNYELTVSDIPGGKRYLLRLKLSELYPMTVRAGVPLRFSLLVNEHDGKRRAGYVNWANGIGEDKNPVVYGTLELR